MYVNDPRRASAPTSPRSTASRAGPPELSPYPPGCLCPVMVATPPFRCPSQKKTTFPLIAAGRRPSTSAGLWAGQYLTYTSLRPFLRNILPERRLSVGRPPPDTRWIYERGGLSWTSVRLRQL